MSDEALIAQIEANDARLARLVEGDDPSPRRGGAGRQIALGARAAVQGALGPFYDAAGAVINLPVAAYNDLTGSRVPLPVRTLNQNLTAAGAPEPENAAERMTSRVVQEVGGLAAPMGVGRALAGGASAGGQALGRALLAAPGTQVAGAVGAGIGAGAAQEVAPGNVGAELGAALTGGLVGGAAPAVGRGAAGLAASAVQPFRESGRAQIATEAVLRQSADPENLARRLAAGLDDPARRLPGQPVTSAQAARDSGLAVFESGLRNSRRDVAAPLDSFDPATTLRDMEARRNSGRLAFLDDRVPPGDTAVSGAEVRRTLREQEGPRRQAVSAAYEGVDPDGSAVLPFDPVRRALDDALGRYYGDLSGGAPLALASIRDDLLGVGDTVPWRSAQNLRSRLSQIEEDAARLGDARMGAAAREVRAAIDTSAARAAGEWVPEGRPITLEDLDRLATAEGRAARPDIAAAPERVVSIDNALTPEAAVQWSAAQQLRRDLAQDFGRDRSGASGVQMVLRGGEARPVIGDRSVPGVFLSSPENVAQALRAAGPQAAVVRQQLRDEFTRRMREASVSAGETLDSAGNAVRTTSPSGATRFFERSLPVARLLFDEPEMAQLQRLMADFSETAAVEGASRARGSPTAQNLLMANMLARVGMPRAAVSATGATAAPLLGMAAGGLVGGAAGAQIGGVLGGGIGATAAPMLLRQAYSVPGRLVQEEVGQLMVDPQRLAGALRALPPSALRRASMGPEDAQAAMRAALARQLMLGANSAAQAE